MAVEQQRGGGALLVRVPVTAPRDLARLPTVPAPHRCTCTVNVVDMDADTIAGLARRGYDVGPFANVRAASTPCADVLVDGPLAVDRTWIQPLLAVADRVFALDLGPVSRVLAAELAAHRALGTQRLQALAAASEGGYGGASQQSPSA